MYQEVCSTVDEVNHNRRPQRKRVLRARDVIPPFDRSILPSDDGAADAESLVARPAPREHPVRADAGATPRSLPIEAGQIPTYDLAENILAEQRRVAARRRRAPGRMEEISVAPIHGIIARPSIPENASQDLLELQRIVAEIVARDIERLWSARASVTGSAT